MISAPAIAVAAARDPRLALPGPIFFEQRRSGLYGRPFTMYKLRTMIPDAEQQEGRTDASQRDGRALSSRSRTDPRVTPVGRFLRKFSIDELPQFYNVLKR